MSLGKHRIKMSELKKMQDEELNKTLKETISELAVLRHKASTGSLDNPARIKQLRKNKARILTLLNQKKQTKNKWSFLKITKKNIIYHELIGLFVCIIKHLDVSLEGRCGKVYYETKNTLIIKEGDNEITVLKNGAIFEFNIDGEKILVYGEQILGRPEDRIKNMLKWFAYL